MFLVGCARLALAPSDARADDFDESVRLGPRELGLGESVLATPVGVAAVRLNPAGAALTRSYVIEGDIGLSPAVEGRYLAASVCDSSTARVGACVYYGHFSSEPADGARSLSEVSLTSAMPLGDALIIGITNKYVDYEAPAGAKDPSISGYLMDAGLIARPAPWFAVGVAGMNLVGHDDARFARSLGAGAAVTFPGLTVAADVRQDDETKTERYGAGIEYLFGQGYPLRAGYVHDGASGASYVTGGVGFITPSMALDLAARRQLGGDEGWVMTLGLRLFVPS